MFCADRPDDELRSEQRLRDGEGIVGFAPGIRIDDDADALVVATV